MNLRVDGLSAQLNDIPVSTIISTRRLCMISTLFGVKGVFLNFSNCSRSNLLVSVYPSIRKGLILILCFGLDSAYPSAVTTSMLCMFSSGYWVFEPVLPTHCPHLHRNGCNEQNSNGFLASVPSFGSFPILCFLSTSVARCFGSGRLQSRKREAKGKVIILRANHYLTINPIML